MNFTDTGGDNIVSLSLGEVGNCHKNKVLITDVKVLV